MHGHPLVDTRPAYSITKSSGTLTIQILADRIPAEEMQILSFHPGMVYGAAWEAQGVPEDAIFLDDGESSQHTPSYLVAAACHIRALQISI